MTGTMFVDGVLRQAPYQFLQPTATLHEGALALLKDLIEPLAEDVAAYQRARLRDQRASRKRKRNSLAPQEPVENVLRLKKLATSGFAVEQVWEQARRILDSVQVTNSSRIADVNAQRPLEIHRLAGTTNGNSEYDDHGAGTERLVLSGSDAEMFSSGSEEGGDDLEQASILEDTVAAEDDLQTGEDDYLGAEEEEVAAHSGGSTAVSGYKDKFGLNDGFFSIDHFNQLSSFLERQDAAGGSDDGRASDEEELDWDADPLDASSAVAQKSIALSRGLRAADRNRREDDIEAPNGLVSRAALNIRSDTSSEDDGPTFASYHGRNTFSDDSDNDGSAAALEEEHIGIGALADTSNVRYADFFEPPQSNATMPGNGQSRTKQQPRQSALQESHEEFGDQIDRTMSRVHHDLFSESSGAEDSDEPLEPGASMRNMSSHERRQAALREEIRKLENELVSKRDWQMSGEVRAIDRPVNALLEEDLDFERVGKPIPVITAEVSEDIEAMIKRRIIAKEFDEVIRRQAGQLTSASRSLRLDVEVSDQKNRRGLAELYEEDHLRKTDSNFVDANTEKVKAEHAEIDRLWRQVCVKLDALSSWHYRPKPPAPQLEVRVNAPTITLEDARPTAGREVSGASALAPQEVYKAGDALANDEIVGGDGLPVAKSELSREQKKRRRMREKERAKKAGGHENQTSNGKKNGPSDSRSLAQASLLGDLKRGGVKAIGQKGQLLDMDGETARQASFAQITGGAFKL